MILAQKRFLKPFFVLLAIFVIDEPGRWIPDSLEFLDPTPWERHLPSNEGFFSPANHA
jgi:hypothetical protein